MKAKYSLLFLLTVFSLEGYAQDLWPHENARWRSELSFFLFTPAWEETYVNGDTAIDGENCTKITSDLIFAFPDEPSNFEVQSTSTAYVFYNGDTLFWRYEDAFYPLVCFNAEVGDSWYPMPPSGIQPGCDTVPMTVVQADSVEYNNEWYRRIRIENSSEVDYPPFYWGGQFNERTFGKNMFFPEYGFCEGVVDYYLLNFTCYGDNELTIPNIDGLCGLALSIHSRSKGEEIKLYPNPVKRGMDFDLKDARAVSLLSLTGRVVKVWPKGDLFTIPEDVAPGTYLIELALPSGRVAYAKVQVI